MAITASNLYATASEVATISGCEAQYYHSKQGYRTGLLATDRAAADTSLAIHDAAMEYHRRMENAYLQAMLPTEEAGRDLLRALLNKQLQRRGLNGNGSVAERLKKLNGGIDRLASLVLTDMPGWAIDGTTGDLLVWAEARLDHGPDLRAVQLEPGYLISTRPDVIGLRPIGGGIVRAVVRDFKAKGEVVDPNTDDGILVRGLWALLEIRQPRCRWFLADRDLAVDPDYVDLETVNIMHADGDEFLMNSTLAATNLFAERDRFVGIMNRMDEVLKLADARNVPASPSGLCQNYCAFLNRCEAGMRHIRKYAGPEALQARIGNA